MVRQIPRDPESIPLTLKGYNITQSEVLPDRLVKFLKHKEKKNILEVQTESTFFFLLGCHVSQQTDILHFVDLKGGRITPRCVVPAKYND